MIKLEKKIINLDWASDYRYKNNKEIEKTIKNDIKNFNIENKTNIKLVKIVDFYSSSTFPNVDLLLNLDEFKKLTLMDEEDFKDLEI